MDRTNSIETASHHDEDDEFDEAEDESNMIDDDDDDDDYEDDDDEEETLAKLIETNRLELVNSIDLQRQLFFRYFNSFL